MEEFKMKRMLFFVVFGICFFSSVVFGIEGSGANGTIAFDVTPNISAQELNALQSQSLSRYVKIVRDGEDGGKIVWESLINKSEDYNISVPEGKYKFYVQVQGHRTIWELDNDGEDYNISSSESVLIPLWANTDWKDVFADAPWRIEPGLSIPVLVMVKDAQSGFMDYDIGNVEIYQDNDCDKDPSDPSDTLLYTETKWYGNVIDDNLGNYNLYNQSWRLV